MRLFRSEYWNVGTGTVRGGSTAHGESLVDIESYLEPLRGALLAVLVSHGVADGLGVTAVSGQPGLSVSTGTGIDAQGRVAVLGDGGAAVIDQAVPPDQVQNVPVVLVTAAGVDLPTAGLTGDVVLTLTWREVLDSTSPGASPTLLHAPWLRLENAATFTDDGMSVVLATVSLDAAGAVTALGTGIRRPVSLPAGGLSFRSTGATAGASPAVAESAGAQLQPRGDGGLDVVLPGGPAGTAATGALTLQGDGTLLLGGDVGIGTAAPGAGLDVDRGALTTPGLRLSASGPGWGAGLQLRNRAGHTYGSYAGDDGVWHFADVDHGVDRLTVDTGGNVRIGTPGAAARSLHVEGSEVHSGGPGAGFSFADRTRPGFTEIPAAGERWVWYAQDGYARLWSGSDRLTVGAPGDGGGLDVPRRARLRQGPDNSAGMWLHQNGSGDAAFIGMADDTHVGLYGRGTGWGLTMDVNTGALQAHGLAMFSADLRVRSANAVASWSGGGITTFDLFAGGAVYVGQDFEHPRIVMSSDGTKRFVIDHPLDPETRDLHHVCIEGPEAAVFYRGSGRLAGGRAEVELPAYFEALARAEGRTVMLTPVAEDGEPVSSLAASPVRGGRFTVRAADGRNPGQRFSWQVTAVRADVEPLAAETAKAGRVPAGVS